MAGKCTAASMPWMSSRQRPACRCCWWFDTAVGAGRSEYRVMCQMDSAGAGACGAGAVFPLCEFTKDVDSSLAVVVAASLSAP